MTSHFIRPFPLCLLLSILPVSAFSDNLTSNKQPTHCTTASSVKNNVFANDAAIYLSADELVSRQSTVFDISGQVSIKTNRHAIKADKAQYNRRQNTLHAQGNIRYREKSLLIESDKLEVNLMSNAGSAENTRYHLLDQGTNGVAGKITFNNAQSAQIALDKSTYSTCKEENRVWQIRAKRIELHPENNAVIARNMRLEIVNVPVIYLPYISLPLQGRKSGFLAPRPGYSSDKGADVAVPYYVNLKPNYDLTLTPRFIETRGAQLATEFRYLQKKTSGNVGVEVLPNDKQTGNTRAYLTLNHRNQVTDSTSFALGFAQVTDKQYFSNLGTELNTLNRSSLNRSFSSETQGENWLFRTTVQDFQMLDNNPAPYRRVPQFDLMALGNAGAFQWRSNTQYSYFRKSNQNYVHRAIVSPQISAPLRRQYGYLIPTIDLRAALYQISEPEITNEGFLNWQFNTKTGLYFERNGKNAYQTLTPELQYSYIPYKKQNQLPIIDTDVLYYDLDQLFTVNRYSGYDRLGDENRLSWSLTTDYTVNTQTKPLFYAQIAQAIYLADHKIRLANEKQIKKNDLVSAALIKSQFSGFLSGKIQAYHFFGENKLNNANMSLNYQKSQQQVELSYRYIDQSIEQISVIGIVDISSKWRIASRWLYSLNSERTREALLGLEYNSCCWAIRLMGRQYATPFADADNRNLRTSVGLQIELKGLTKIGSNLNKQFSDEVFGNQ